VFSPLLAPPDEVAGTFRTMILAVVVEVWTC
jgi:hypothetical protein